MVRIGSKSTTIIRIAWFYRCDIVMLRYSTWLLRASILRLCLTIVKKCLRSIKRMNRVITVVIIAIVDGDVIVLGWLDIRLSSIETFRQTWSIILEWRNSIDIANNSLIETRLCLKVCLWRVDKGRRTVPISFKLGNGNGNMLICCRHLLTLILR